MFVYRVADLLLTFPQTLGTCDWTVELRSLVNFRAPCRGRRNLARCRTAGCWTAFVDSEKQSVLSVMSRREFACSDPETGYRGERGAMVPLSLCCVVPGPEGGPK